MIMDRVPSNLDQAVEMIVTSLSDDERNYIIKCCPETFHFTTGMWLRNNWDLWDRDTIFVQWCIKNLEIGHADDISGTIFAAVWAWVRNERFDVIQHVQRYKDHWRKAGVDPITQKPL